MGCMGDIIFQQTKAGGWEKDLGALVPVRRRGVAVACAGICNIPAHLWMGEFLWELVQEVQVCIPPIRVRYDKYTFIAKDGAHPLTPRTPRSCAVSWFSLFPFHSVSYPNWEPSERIRQSQGGIEGAAPVVSEKMAGGLPLEPMPSHNDLAVPQPATPATNCGIHIREHTFTSHRGIVPQPDSKVKPQRQEHRKAVFPACLECKLQPDRSGSMQTISPRI